jgi:two-component system, OmpR family, KDP operon response regulator KdpE
LTTDASLILVIEDELPVRRFLRASLAAHGFRVIEAETGNEGLSLAASHNPDVVLLDLGLPDGDGVAWLGRLREWSRVPVIVISARGREDDKVLALDAGADDYLTKPFGVGELLARIRVALRHAHGIAAPSDATIELQGLQVDLARHEVRIDGREVRLTPTEFKILVLLARNAGKVLTHRQILNEVWGPGHAGENHNVRVHVALLRKKLEPDPMHPRRLMTETGVGYRLRDRETD